MYILFYTLKPVGMRARGVFTEAEDAHIGPRAPVDKFLKTENINRFISD